MGYFEGLHDRKAIGHFDEVLLVEAMLCVSMADGEEQFEERNLIRAFLATLPELKGQDTLAIYRQAEENVKRDGSLERVKALAGLGSETLKHKAFLLAMDVAMSSGDVDEKEEAVLIAMREALGVPEELADGMARILRIKYATG